MATSSTAFAIIKWAGVAYLVWLRLPQWRASSAPLAVGHEAQPATSPWQLVRRGWAVNTINPKGTVFLLAVVPQFTDLGQPLWPQYLVICATLAFTDLVVMAGYTALAAKVLATLQSAAHMHWLNRFFGALFVMAGLGLAAFKPAA